MYACVGGVKEGVALILDSSLTDYYTPLWREKLNKEKKGGKAHLFCGFSITDQKQ